MENENHQDILNRINSVNSDKDSTEFEKVINILKDINRLKANFDEKDSLEYSLEQQKLPQRKGEPYILLTTLTKPNMLYLWPL